MKMLSQDSCNSADTEILYHLNRSLHYTNQLSDVLGDSCNNSVVIRILKLDFCICNLLNP
jgi:hypothetical protein